MLSVNVITADNDLVELAADINRGLWDEANAMAEYSAAALAAYLARQDTVFLACYEIDNPQRTLVGIASSRIEIKPYGEERWLYIDEIDVCADHRRKGAGKAIMQKLLDIARESDCEEVWLGTELDNHPANALYQSLEPDAAEQFVGYTYELDE